MWTLRPKHGSCSTVTISFVQRFMVEAGSGSVCFDSVRIMTTGRYLINQSTKNKVVKFRYNLVTLCFSLSFICSTKQLGRISCKNT